MTPKRVPIAANLAVEVSLGLPPFLYMRASPDATPRADALANDRQRSDTSREADVVSALNEEVILGKCEMCGNDYERSFDVIAAGTKHTFDSFECAIHSLAPVCDHCGCKIIGHGIEASGTFYCCAHCARESGVTAVADHV